MRRQYHFRASEGRLLAWNVHRLVELAEQLEPFQVPLESIQELDEPYWFDQDEPPPTCRAIIEHMRLVEAADLIHPIILCADGRLMDGLHRVAKAMLLGQSQIRAVRFPKTPRPDHVGVAPDELPYDDLSPDTFPPQSG